MAAIASAWVLIACCSSGVIGFTRMTTSSISLFLSLYS
jgi:hypothetical protein